MIKVMLINPPIYDLDEPGDRPPLGILYIAAVVEKCLGKARIEIIDLALDPAINIKKALADSQPEVVGITDR